MILVTEVKVFTLIWLCNDL